MSLLVRTFPVLAHEVHGLTRALQALVKRANRLSVPPFTFDFGAPETKRISTNDQVGGRTYLETRVPCTLTGDSPTVAGWTFIATLQHLDGQNIVRRVGDEHEVPVEFWTRGPVCDHCGLARRRNDTYVLRFEGPNDAVCTNVECEGCAICDDKTPQKQYMQVGSSCLEDFLGTDRAGQLAAMASLYADACALADRDDFGAGSGEARNGCEGLGSYLVCVATAIRTWGWVSGKQAQEKGGSSTRDMLNRAKARDAKPNEILPAATDADVARAEAALEWAANLNEDTIGVNDYLHNLHVVAASGIVEPRTQGIACSILTAFERTEEKARASRETAQTSTWFGTVGERSKVGYVLTLRAVKTWEGDYGTTWMYRFVSSEGNVAIWRSSRNIELEMGNTYIVKGTIKAHSEYKGTKQTDLTRCAVAADIKYATSNVRPSESAETWK